MVRLSQGHHHFKVKVILESSGVSISIPKRAVGFRLNTYLVLDAKSNEKVIERLTSAIEVQEETMEKQDEILQKREEEIKQLQNG